MFYDSAAETLFDLEICSKNGMCVQSKTKLMSVSLLYKRWACLFWVYQPDKKYCVSVTWSILNAQEIMYIGNVRNTVNVPGIQLSDSAKEHQGLPGQIAYHVSRAVELLA